MPRLSDVRILGIDPGLTRTGYAVITGTRSHPVALTYGCINTEKIVGTNQRLARIAQQLDAIVQEFHPTHAAVEKLYFSRNVTSALTVGQARGVILLQLTNHNIPVQEFTPQQVKQAVSGYGGATKTQVQRMVVLLLHLATIPKPDDVTDALAVALTASAHT